MTRIIAHRGASGRYPENSREAVTQAARCGADMIEIDIRRCSDGVPVLCHDKKLRRLFGRQGTIGEIESREFTELQACGEGTPLTLKDFLTMDDLRIPFILDVKEFGLEKPVCSLIKQFDAADRLIVSSFYSLVIRAFKREMPSLKTALILDRVATLPFSLGLIAASRPYLRFTGAEYVHMYYRQSNIRAAKALKSIGYQVAFWTIDQPQDMFEALDADPYGIMTNVPEKMIAELKANRPV